MCKTKFYLCETCGNLVSLYNEGGGTLVCCENDMKELIPGTVDASLEKHIPVIEVEGNKVTVTIGSVIHPMVDEHWIEWIYLETKEGTQRKCLEPGCEPKAVFMLAEGDEVVSAYEHCNLHGLWKKEI